jgi:hypothetical protein
MARSTLRLRITELCYCRETIRAGLTEYCVRSMPGPFCEVSPVGMVEAHPVLGRGSRGGRRDRALGQLPPARDVAAYEAL